MTACRQAIETLRCRVREQMDALTTLNEIVSHEVEGIRRHDQCVYLRDLKERVRQEVRDVEVGEAISAYHFAGAKLTGGFTHLITGTLGATLAKTREHPLSAGLRRAQAEFKRTEPFDTVLVALRPGDRKQEVEVIPLSRLAREHGRSEAETRAKLEADGCLLVEPEAFFKAVDGLEEKVLNGNLPMPSAASSSPGEQGQVLDHAFVLASLAQGLQPTTGRIWVVRRRY